MMEDSPSPNSSRESTPFPDNGYDVSGRQYRTSDSITELSRDLDRHTLTTRTRRPSTSPEGPGTRPCEQIQHLQSPTSFSNRVCRRRQSINRLQPSSSHLTRISTLVENMVQTGQPLYDSTHPRAMLDDSTSPSLSPDEVSPNTSFYFGFSPISPSSVSSGSDLAQHSQRYFQSRRIDRELRHSASKDGNITLVRKKIRMRKSSKNLVKGDGRRFERDR